MKRRTNFYFFYFVVLFFFMISSFFLLDFEVENHKSNQVYHKVIQDLSFHYQEEEYPYLTIDLTNSYQMNPDTVGWVEVPHTNISYPVVQTTDNSYYLNHSFDRSENSAGWVFMDYRNQSILDDQVILYGHNRLDGSMFGSLKDLLNSEREYVFYNTQNLKLTYEIFSMYIIDVDEFQSTSQFSSESDYMEYLEWIQKKSVVPSDVILHSTDKIITFYTCYGYGRERLIMHAKLVQIKEDL